MKQNGFMKIIVTQPVAEKTVKDLKLQPCLTANPRNSIKNVVRIMKNNKICEILIVENEEVLGIATCVEINKKLVSLLADKDDAVEGVMITNFQSFKISTSLAFLAVWLEDKTFAVIKDEGFFSIVYPVDLSEFLVAN